MVVINIVIVINDWRFIDSLAKRAVFNTVFNTVVVVNKAVFALCLTL